MTITYHAGRRIQGLSTDTVETPTYSDDFSGTDDWVDQGSGVGVNTTTDRLEFSSWTDNTTNNSSTLDLGSALSDTAWVIRFKLQWTGFSNTTDWTAPAIGMFSTSSATAGNSAQDGLFYWGIANGATKASYISSIDNTTISGTDTNLNYAWVTGTTYYFELVRDGSSFTTTIWTGSYGGTEVASGTNTIDGTNTGLRYFGAKSPVKNRGGSFTGWLDDLKIWNGITSLTSKPTNVQSGSRFEETDTRKIYYGELPSVTFEDDFTSYADVNAGNAVWSSENTSYSYVDVNNDNLKINQPYSTSVHAYIAKDLGNNVSNTAWVCRYKLNFSTWNTGSEFHLILHEADQTVASNATGYNVAGIRISAQSSPDRILLIATSSGSDRSSVGSGSSFTVSTGTDYYVEMIRNGDDFTVTVRTGSHSGTVSATTTETVSGIDSLRYFKISNVDWDVTTSTGDIVCTLDDFEFYNGFTTTTDVEWTEEV